MIKGWSRHRCIAFVAVAALHFLFIWMLWVREPDTRRAAHDNPSSVLFFIDVPPAPPRTVPTIRVPRVRQISPLIVEPVSVEPGTPEETSAPAAPSNSSPTIDWTAQATESATAAVDKAIRDETRKCDPEDRPKSFLPPCHPKKSKPFEWNPDASRVGFANGLPFVRVGERCVIGLGFFGCGFGEAPPANGDLFEGMDDPERERSSVPSSDPR